MWIGQFAFTLGVWVPARSVALTPAADAVAVCPEPADAVAALDGGVPAAAPLDVVAGALAVDVVVFVELLVGVFDEPPHPARKASTQAPSAAAPINRPRALAARCARPAPTRPP